jgi:hypothetical protein
VLQIVFDHYNRHRPHRALNLSPPDRQQPTLRLVTPAKPDTHRTPRPPGWTDPRVHPRRVDRVPGPTRPQARHRRSAHPLNTSRQGARVFGTHTPKPPGTESRPTLAGPQKASQRVELERPAPKTTDPGPIQDRTAAAAQPSTASGALSTPRGVGNFREQAWGTPASLDTMAHRQE